MKVNFIKGSWTNDDVDLLPTIKFRRSSRINQETQIKVIGTSLTLCWLKWGIMAFQGKIIKSNQNNMKQERKAWILLGSIFLVFVLYTPKKQQKHEPKKIQYGNYERLPDRYYELP